MAGFVMLTSAKQKALVFASGSKDGGGSGFLHLILNVAVNNLPIEIVGVVCNHPNGGVRAIADRHNVKFYLLESFTEKDYQAVVAESEARWFLLSGWLKFVLGLDPVRTINIHPGPLPQFGGEGMYGHHVHEAVLRAGLEYTAVTMHYVTPSGYDRGPTFFEYNISTAGCPSAAELGALVNRYEHGWQSFITSLVVSGQIIWSGKPTDEVIVPYWYRMMPFCPQRLRLAPC